MGEGLEFLVGGGKWVIDSSRKAVQKRLGRRREQSALRKGPGSPRGRRRLS